MYKEKVVEKHLRNQKVTRLYESRKDPFVHTYDLVVSVTFFKAL